MPNWLEKEAVPEIIDPQLEYARLARQQGGQQKDGDRLSGNPPPVVDSDFCFNEEIKK